jgi:hypothetical protein
MFPFLLLRLADDLTGYELIGLCIGLYCLAAYCAQPVFELVYSLTPWRGHWTLACALSTLTVGWLLCGLTHTRWQFVFASTFVGIGTAGVLRASDLVKRDITSRGIKKAYTWGLTGSSWLAFLIAPL